MDNVSIPPAATHITAQQRKESKKKRFMKILCETMILLGVLIIFLAIVATHIIDENIQKRKRK